MDERTPRACNKRKKKRSCFSPNCEPRANVQLRQLIGIKLYLWTSPIMMSDDSLLCPCSTPALLTPVSGSSSASVTSSDKYAVFKQLSVDQPAEPTPPASGTLDTSCNSVSPLGGTYWDQNIKSVREGNNIIITAAWGTARSVPSCVDNWQGFIKSRKW